GAGQWQGDRMGPRPVSPLPHHLRSRRRRKPDGGCRFPRLRPRRRRRGPGVLLRAHGGPAGTRPGAEAQPRRGPGAAPTRFAAAVTWEAQGAGLFIDAAEVRALADMKPPDAPETPPGAGTGRDVYREGIRSLALVRTEGDHRSSAWLLDRARRLLLTTAEAV